MAPRQSKVTKTAKAKPASAAPARKPRKPRMTKAEREAKNKADRLAAMAEPSSSDLLSPPRFFVETPGMAIALATWTRLVPVLSKTVMMDTTHREMFALFCYYRAEFYAAALDIDANGYSVMVKTVSGDMMPRKNQSVDRRKEAVDQMMDLAKRFGLTPSDMYSLTKSAMSHPEGPWFGQPLPPQDGGKPKTGDDDEATPPPDPHGDEWSTVMAQGTKRVQ